MDKKVLGVALDSPSWKINLKDLWAGVVAFFAVLVPIFFYNLLQNMPELYEIAISALTALNWPHWLMLLVVPFVSALFAVAALYFVNNSKKPE